MFLKAKLNTLHMYDDVDAQEEDLQMHRGIAEFMHGEVAIVSPALDGSRAYHLVCLTDEKKDKELAYRMEQDSTTGRFIDNREEFEKAYDGGEYDSEGWLALEQEHVMILPAEGQADKD